MPVREIVNALFLTYICTEWMLATANESRHYNKSSQMLAILVQNKLFAILVAFINIVDVLKNSFTPTALTTLWHVRIALAVFAYMVALYVDCKRSQPKLTLTNFLRQVAIAFLRVLPVYPFLAVLISFVFLFVISAFETLHLPLEMLNMPIYYGTLYGPFSYIYYVVKRRVIESTQPIACSCQDRLSSYPSIQGALLDVKLEGADGIFFDS
eukprot:scaffold2164_cov106-Cylindrotheca_fusiformis.AAC.12